MLSNLKLNFMARRYMPCPFFIPENRIDNRYLYRSFSSSSRKLHAYGISTGKKRLTGSVYQVGLIVSENHQKYNQTAFEISDIISPIQKPIASAVIHTHNVIVMNCFMVIIPPPLSHTCISYYTEIVYLNFLYVH